VGIKQNSILLFCTFMLLVMNFFVQPLQSSIRAVYEVKQNTALFTKFSSSLGILLDYSSRVFCDSKTPSVV